MIKFSTLNKKTIISFFLMVILCGFVIIISIINRSNIERITMEQTITEKSIKINEVISKLLYKTQSLSALVIHNDGSVKDFDRIAATIIDDPVILNVLLAPDGVVSHVYPKQGNEAVIGLNYFEAGAGNREAVMAKESGQLVFGGPFNLVQGGQALVGRLPVYINDSDNQGQFWGIVSVTLKYPQILDYVEMSELSTRGFSYEIWRINPDTDEKQIIANSDITGTIHTRFIESDIQIFNAEWFFRIAPIRQWYQYPESWLMILAGLCISFLVAFTVQSNMELKLIKSNLEDISRTDCLTGISNRWSFMETAASKAVKPSDSNRNNFVVMFDMDYFKNINDMHGHPVGDDVLRIAVQRVRNVIRPQDLLARYGGEEFVILVTDIDLQNMQLMMERVRLCLCEAPVKFKDTQIPISASFGIALMAHASKLESAIELADQALYIAKKEGRNKVVFSDKCEVKRPAASYEV